VNPPTITIHLVLGYGVQPLDDPKHRDFGHHCRQMKAVAQELMPGDVIMLLGGCTNPEYNPRLSEAAVMEQFLRKKKLLLSGVHLFREERSRSTVENILFARDIIAKELFSEPHGLLRKTDVARILVHGDSIRQKRIKLLAPLFLKKFDLPLDFRFQDLTAWCCGDDHAAYKKEYRRQQLAYQFTWALAHLPFRQSWLKKLG